MMKMAVFNLFFSFFFFPSHVLCIVYIYYDNVCMSWRCICHGGVLLVNKVFLFSVLSLVDSEDDQQVLKKSKGRKTC